MPQLLQHVRCISGQSKGSRCKSPDNFGEKDDISKHDTCIFCKRRMYRIATACADSIGARGIVTGESLGQVASQTLENPAVLTDAATIPIYRPLIGFDKEDAISLAREIGTFPESISPASGCRAVPAGPSTKAKLEVIRQIEAGLEAGLIACPANDDFGGRGMSGTLPGP